MPSLIIPKRHSTAPTQSSNQHQIHHRPLTPQSLSDILIRLEGDEYDSLEPRPDPGLFSPASPNSRQDRLVNTPINISDPIIPLCLKSSPLAADKPDTLEASQDPALTAYGGVARNPKLSLLLPFMYVCMYVPK